MPLDRQEFARRLREAREACGLTQQQVAEKLNVSRPTVAQMELGNRDVSSLELEQLAFLYGRDIRAFFAEAFAPQDALTVLFRAGPELAQSEGATEALRRCIALGRELSNLEELLGIDRDFLVPATYSLQTPANRWEAIKQGELIAEEERRRLNLGDSAVSDITEIFEAQGIRTAELSLPNEISGLTVRHSATGVLVAVNEAHVPLRKRFSLSHEYAHVLLDGAREGTISRTSERNELVEVRANSFAANFLMLESGVRRFIASLGKGDSSRASAEVFDEAGVVRVQHRTRAGSQTIQIYEIAQLAHAFGVSSIAALYRVRNVRPPLVTEPEFERLKHLIEEGLDKEAANVMNLSQDEWTKSQDEIKRRLLGLALEAYRQELMSHAKLKELGELAGVPYDRLAKLVSTAGIGT